MLQAGAPFVRFKRDFEQQFDELLFATRGKIALHVVKRSQLRFCVVEVIIIFIKIFICIILIIQALTVGKFFQLIVNIK